MALGDYSRRRRRWASWRVIQVVLLLVLMTGGVGYAYQVGVAAREAKTAQPCALAQNGHAGGGQASGSTSAGGTATR